MDIFSNSKFSFFSGGNYLRCISRVLVHSREMVIDENFLCTHYHTEDGD